LGGVRVVGAGVHLELGQLPAVMGFAWFIEIVWV
jgi:hypothetical protein